MMGWGLVDHVHPADRVESETLVFAHKLASRPRAVTIAYKRIFAALADGNVARAEQLRDGELGSVA